MPLIPLLVHTALVHTALAASPPEAPAPSFADWHLAFSELDPMLVALVSDWRAQGGAAPPDDEWARWFQTYNELQFQQSAAKTERTMKQEARRVAVQAARDTAYKEQLCAAERSAHQDELALGVPDLQRRATATLMALRTGDTTERSTRVAFLRWWSAYSGLNWDQALSKEGSLRGVQDARRALNASLETTAPDALGGLAFTLNAADQMLALRIKLHEDRCHPDAVAPLQAEAARLEGALSALDQQLAGTLSALAGHMLRRPAGLDPENSPLLSQARTISGAYDHLLDALDQLNDPMDAPSWCRAQVDGALARLLAESDGALHLLDSAVAAWPNGCADAVARWSDIEPFVRLWVEARYEASNRPMARLWIQGDDGHWSIDGLEKSVVGTEPIAIRPGRHRLEHNTPASGPRATVVELVGGWDYQLLDQGERLELALVEEGATEEESPRPWPRRDDDDDQRKEGKTRPASTWRLAAGSTYLQFLDLPHVGGTFQASRRLPLKTGPTLAVGLAQDLARGEETWGYTDTLTSRVLVRERLFLEISGDEDWALRPRTELFVGMIPLNAGLVGASLGVDRKLGEHSFFTLQATAALQIWAGPLALVDAHHGDIGATAGLGMNL